MASIEVHGADEGSSPDRTIKQSDHVTRSGSWAITAALAIVFLWFGGLKFLSFEQQSLVGIISNNPLISWLYKIFGVAGGAIFLGVFEVTTGLLIAGRLLHPRLSVIGSAMGVWSFLLTISCMFTTPGVIQSGYEGTPALSALPGAFLLKDIVLLSACWWLLGTSLTELRNRRHTQPGR
ncbi:YkgB family protein [Sphingosinicellaceae bacterium]|nr:YkgB family protein [Sphingosinicellaceae bacterium]